jgi:hypothetical protein
MYCTWLLSGLAYFLYPFCHVLQAHGLTAPPETTFMLPC